MRTFRSPVYFAEPSGLEPETRQPYDACYHYTKVLSRHASFLAAGCERNSVIRCSNSLSIKITQVIHLFAVVRRIELRAPSCTLGAFFSAELSRISVGDIQSAGHTPLNYTTICCGDGGNRTHALTLTVSRSTFELHPLI